MLGVQGRSDLDLGQSTQRYGHDQVIGLVAGAANLDSDPAAVLDDGGDWRAGLDGFQLLDESLGQYRAATRQAGGTQVTVADAAVDTALLGEVKQ
ncbi:hypothetical protein D3C79_730990 [compost metagenome]